MTSRSEPAWRSPDWSSTTTAWVDGVLAELGTPRTGELTVVRSWSLSHVERVPTTAGDRFVKASAEHFAHEPAITEWLSRHFPDDVPEVVAADPTRRCLLLLPLDGADAATGAALPAAATTLARIQRGCVGEVDALLALGVPCRSLPETRSRFLQIVDDGGELGLLEPTERDALRAAVPWILDQVAELGSIGLPDTISHGDLHLGNVAEAGGRTRIFDWSDACVGHPFLDLAHLIVRLPEVADAVPPQWYEPYLAAWRDGWTDQALRRAVDLAVVVDRVFQSVTLEDLRTAVASPGDPSLIGLQARRLRELVAARR